MGVCYTELTGGDVGAVRGGAEKLKVPLCWAESNCKWDSVRQQTAGTVFGDSQR